MTQTFQSFQACLIHYSEICESDQQNTFRTFNKLATVFFTDAINLDNKAQASNSNLGTVVSFTGATQHFPVHKLTLTPCLQTHLTYTTAPLATLDASPNACRYKSSISQHITCLLVSICLIAFNSLKNDFHLSLTSVFTLLFYWHFCIAVFLNNNLG